MKVYYECGACYLRQAREALDLSTNDDELKLQITSEVIKLLAENFKKGASSNATGSKIHKLIREKTKCPDPYKNKKILGNQIAENLLPKIKKILKKDNTLENYVKISILGNILDFGTYSISTDIKSLLNENLNNQLIINDVKKLDESLKKHKQLLYLVDNTGEIVFDKLLLEKIKKDYDIDITVAVKESPVLNDACTEDALQVGLDKYAKIITIGTDTVGVVYEEISPEFKNIFNNSKFIISKGMGNYEGLTEITFNKNQDVFYLLCSKCKANAIDLNVNVGDMVLKKA